jgi:hypothetical protein
MPYDDDNYLDKISDDSKNSPEQVRLNVTEALKCLHKTIYSNQGSASDAILNCIIILEQKHVFISV